jgi:asparagine synthetase B (glutamine-hydrolysing)
MIEFLLEIQLNAKVTELDKLFIQKPKIKLYLTGDEYEFIAWGDPIYNSDFKGRLQKDPSPDFFLNNLNGHYYYILHNKIAAEIVVGNSMFSILPLYYSQDRDKIVFSENALRLGDYLKINQISGSFVLETVLFNYPLYNQSILENIKLLPSNSYLKISASEITIIKHTRIEEYFSTHPIPWRKSVIDLRDIFLETIEKYLPDEKYVHALTGGFDGRTLVSAALYHKRDFSCYCFGSEESRDTLIASQLTSQAGIPFLNIELNSEYADHDSLDCGKEFIENSSGTATFARAHYLHAAKRLSNHYKYIITGNFGSEILRAAHNAGAVISQNLYALFSSNSPGEGIKAIENSFEFRCQTLSEGKNSWEDLKENITKLPCYNKGYSGLTKNQRFYIFVFEEIFRKYFGAEMATQFRYLKNRTPFLEMDFLKAIFKTELAGINSDFFEHDPFRRYKGQVLYAHIIRKAYPKFGQIMTDKGYKPDDLLNFFGKLNIAKGYLKKIIRKPMPDFDPYAVNRSWEINQNYWNSIPIPSDYFNTSEFQKINKKILYKIISLSYLINTL